jgi:hypothetical protein
MHSKDVFDLCDVFAGWSHYKTIRKSLNCKIGARATAHHEAARQQEGSRPVKCIEPAQFSSESCEPLARARFDFTYANVRSLRVSWTLGAHL